MTYAEQLEQETEATRARIASTLDELRASVTPGHVIDQIADRMSDGATAAFARNLKDQAVSNPLPVALISAGLAWLMLAPRANGGTIRRAAGRMQDTLSEGIDAARSAANSAANAASDKAAGWSESAGSAKATAAEAADALRDKAGAMADQAQSTASAGYEAVSDSARRTAASISDATRSVSQQTLQTGRSLLDFCRDQPLLLAGLGIAAGALAGALLPASEAENRLMGETSDRMKDRARDIAAEQYESARKIGERAADAAKDEARNEATKQSGTEPAGRDNAGGRGDGAGKHEPTLVPEATTTPDEWRGQPWTGEDAPV